MRSLGQLEAEAAEAARWSSYRGGLILEKDAVAATLARLERMDPDEKVELPWVEPHEWPAAQHRTYLRERIAAIDGELSRLGDQPEDSRMAAVSGLSTAALAARAAASASPAARVGV